MHIHYEHGIPTRGASPLLRQGVNGYGLDSEREEELENVAFPS